MDKHIQKITTESDVHQSVYDFCGAYLDNVSQFLHDFRLQRKLRQTRNIEGRAKHLSAVPLMIS